jgi:hypothetical protein
MNRLFFKKGVYLFSLLLILLLAIVAVNSMDGTIPIIKFSSGSTIMKDNFSGGVLNPQTWQITREGDFKESTIDVSDVEPSENIDFRLKLRMNTIGTNDDTIKFHGVRSVEIINFSEGKDISFDLAWNNQSNGAYLTGGVYLSPYATNENPGNEKDWLKFEYVGVPPGLNARSVITTKVDGKTRLLYTEGWPENRTGRHISNQHVNIIIDNKTFKIIENGDEIFASPHDLSFTSAYIYLQMSSHSNYPDREIYFDNVLIDD